MPHPLLHPGVRIAIAALALGACGDDGPCVTPPCAYPMAVVLTLTSAVSGASLTGAVVQATGASTATIPCAGGASATCAVAGYPGTYTLDISAPGFRTERRTVTVSGSAPAACNCGVVNTEQLSVALIAAP